MTDAHFRWNFINAEFSVVANTLMDVTNRNSCHSQWPPRTRTIRPSNHFTYSHACLWRNVCRHFELSIFRKCHHSHTLWPQNLDHTSFFFWGGGVFYRRCSHVERIAVSSPLKRQWQTTRCKLRTVHIVYTRHISQCCQHTFPVQTPIFSSISFYVIHTSSDKGTLIYVIQLFQQLNTYISQAIWYDSFRYPVCSWLFGPDFLFNIFQKCKDAFSAQIE
jgi:hypothetical protein